MLRVLKDVTINNAQIRNAYASSYLMVVAILVYSLDHAAEILCFVDWIRNVDRAT